MPGSPIVAPIQTQLAVRSLVTQLRNPNTSEEDRNHLQQTLNSLLAAAVQRIQQENEQAAEALQNELLALATQSKPSTESLACIVDYLGPEPKKLIAYLQTVCKLSLPISQAIIKQKQLAIANNLLLLIKNGLLSIKEFSCTSLYDATQPRITSLVWATIFADDSLSRELASGAVRRYRLFPQYSKQCETPQLQAYVLACPAAEGTHTFTTDIREKFNDTDERVFQRPTIAYLCDGFRHAQRNWSKKNPWYPLVENEEELFLLHLYDTETDGEHSYIYVDPHHQPEPEDALHFNQLIRELMLETLRNYRNQTNTLTSTSLRTTMLSLHHQYQRHQNHESLKILRHIFHSVLMEYAGQENNFEYAAFLKELKIALKRYIKEERQLMEEYPETTPTQVTTKEAKIRLLCTKLLRSIQKITKQKISSADSETLTPHKKIFQKFLKTFLALLAHIMEKIAANVSSTLNLSAFFQSSKVTSKKHLAQLNSELIPHIIETQLSKPVRLHLTVCITPLLKMATKDETAQLNFLLNEQLMKFVRTSTEQLNYLYAEKALSEDPETLEKDLQAECARLLNTALNFVTIFINNKCDANQTLQAELIQIISTASEAFATISEQTMAPQSQFMLTV